jgi:hypothetical protein
MKLICVYKCKYCGLKFLEESETDSPLVLMDFMFREHQCIENTYGICAKVEGIRGIAELIGFKEIEGEDAESIHSNNKS